MPDMMLACRTCANEFVLKEDELSRSCPACGTQHSRPRALGVSLDCLRRAHHQRVACDFANAERSYQRVLLEYPDEAEALWGLTLCKYGVEYVEDTKSHERLPVVHFMRRKPITEDADYLRACETATAEVRGQYEHDADYIARIQRQTATPAPDAMPVDIFLCYKATREDGSHTREFEHARELYYALRENDYRVFFAHETLKTAAGADYEAQIYQALHASKAMLVVCSDPALLETPWVRSEWSRYLERIDAEEDCRLIPLLYDGCDPYSMPAPFLGRNLQGLRMDELTSLDSLRTVLDRLLGRTADKVDDDALLIDFSELTEKAAAAWKQAGAAFSGLRDKARAAAEQAVAARAERAAARAEQAAAEQAAAEQAAAEQAAARAAQAAAASDSAEQADGAQAAEEQPASDETAVHAMQQLGSTFASLLNKARAALPAAPGEAPADGAASDAPALPPFLSNLAARLPGVTKALLRIGKALGYAVITFAIALSLFASFSQMLKEYWIGIIPLVSVVLPIYCTLKPTSWSDSIHHVFLKLHGLPKNAGLIEQMLFPVCTLLTFVPVRNFLSSFLNDINNPNNPIASNLFMASTSPESYRLIHALIYLACLIAVWAAFRFGLPLLKRSMPTLIGKLKQSAAAHRE